MNETAKQSRPQVRVVRTAPTWTVMVGERAWCSGLWRRSVAEHLARVAEARLERGEQR